ncbi:MAG TPA: 50S ribosomal protein L22 [Terriglobales bacterium]|jgi:large subunit ribosomal protein L22
MNFAAQEFRAEARFQRVSPQKARLVLDLIKGRRVGEALETLHFTNKAIAPSIEKVLRSAVQNATYLSQEKGFDVDVDNLFVKRAVANDGPRMKRIRPAPMGRAYRYQRRISHIEIAIAERALANAASLATTVEAEPAAAPKKKSAAKKTAGKKTATKGTAAKKSAAKKAPAKKSAAKKSSKKD